jgi:hypothetical protein
LTVDELSLIDVTVREGVHWRRRWRGQLVTDISVAALIALAVAKTDTCAKQHGLSSRGQKGI